MAQKPLRVLFITAGLESGGAEMSLYKMVTRMDPSRFECRVLSLTDMGSVLGEKIQAAGIPIEALGFRRGLPNPLMLMALARRIRTLNPGLVQTWMYHADLIGGVAAKLAGNFPIVWAIHSTDFHPTRTKAQTRWVVRLNSRLSSVLPAKITCCSGAALSVHADLGYARDRLCVIHSGIDTEEFVRDSRARSAFCDELQIDVRTPLVGLMARFDPQKDHETFFHAAGLLAKRQPMARFVLCGSGVTPDNPTLAGWAREAGVADRTHFLGLRQDIARVTAALSVATCCSSYGESFSLVLGEAMACGVPCVTTDMEGPVSVVGGLGWVVPRRDPQHLADAWQSALSLSSEERRDWGFRARQSIQARLSLQMTVQQYEAFYEALSAGLRASPPKVGDNVCPT